MVIEIKNEKYYKTAELAELLKTTYQTINRWRQEGRLVATKLSERKYLFSETEVERFLKGDVK